MKSTLLVSVVLAVGCVGSLVGMYGKDRRWGEVGNQMIGPKPSSLPTRAQREASIRVSVNNLLDTVQEDLEMVRKEVTALKATRPDVALRVDAIILRSLSFIPVTRSDGGESAVPEDNADTIPGKVRLALQGLLAQSTVAITNGNNSGADDAKGDDDDAALALTKLQAAVDQLVEDENLLEHLQSFLDH